MKIKYENPSKTDCMNYLIEKSNELNIPTQLALATAWIESRFTQFRADGSTLCNTYSNDFGIMQITIGAKIGESNWGYINNDDWERLLVDWRFNIDVGLNELQDCYFLAYNFNEIMQGLSHFKSLTFEDCIARASYSAYNGGPQKIARYRTPVTKPIDIKKYPFVNADGYDNRDINFWNIYRLKSWQ